MLLCCLCPILPNKKFPQSYFFIENWKKILHHSSFQFSGSQLVCLPYYMAHTISKADSVLLCKIALTVFVPLITVVRDWQTNPSLQTCSLSYLSVLSVFPDGALLLNAVCCIRQVECTLTWSEIAPKIDGWVGSGSSFFCFIELILKCLIHSVIT